MKVVKFEIFFGAACLILMTAAPTFAADKAAELPECAGPVAACEAGGFKRGEHRQNAHGLWVDCIHVAARGKAVPGVAAIDATQAKVCQEAAKALRVERKKAREERRKK